MCTVVMLGCDDGLNIAPTNSVTEDFYWNRVVDAEQAVNGVYSHMDGRTMTLDNRTDIAFQLYASSPIVPSDGIVSSTWNRYYNGIRKANDVLANIDQVEVGDLSVLDRLEAEARFLRAYYYTQLTSLYGDVPFPLEPTEITDHLPRTDRNEIVDFIIDDLNSIISTNALPVSYSGSNVGRATHGAAESLLARVALRNERWQIARDAAQSVIDSGTYELYPDYEALFHYEGQNSSEVIFDRQYSSSGTNYNAFSFLHHPLVADQVWNLFMISICFTGLMIPNITLRILMIQQKPMKTWTHDGDTRCFIQASQLETTFTIPAPTAVLRIR
jgi:starch-binding outer membrane protein, SusD/RagB family